MQPTPQGARHLLQGPSTARSDLVVTVTYPGTTQGGEAVISLCSTGNCTQGVSGVSFVGGNVAAGTLTDLKPPSITLVQQATAAGQPLKFAATYLVGGSPASAPVTLAFNPADALSCSAAATGPGVTTFECRPLVSNIPVVLTAYGPDPRDPNKRIEATLTIPSNTSEYCPCLFLEHDH